MLRCLLLLFLLTLASTGCGAVAQPQAVTETPPVPAETAEPTQVSAPATPVQTSQTETEIVLAIGSDVVGAATEMGFDPIQGWPSLEGSPLFQSTLLRRDAQLGFVNDLATAYEVSPDGLRWTVNIRAEVRFSDGQPLTANDVAFTFNTGIPVSGRFENLVKVVAVDDTTVEFHLKEPRSNFTHVLTNIGIVPAHAYDENYRLKPIGSGPYQLVEWVEGEKLVVEANPYYYGEPPRIKRLTFLLVNEATAFAAAKSGKVHVASVTPALAVEQVAGMKLYALKSADMRGFNLICQPATGQQTERGFPLGNDVLGDPAVRQAINYAIDREALVREVLSGYGTPAYSLVSGLPWENPEGLIADGDPVRARQILAEAGWQDSDGDGIVEKEGLRAEFTIIYPPDDVTRKALALAVLPMLQAGGIEAQAVNHTWDEITSLKNSNAVVFGYGSLDPSDLYRFFHSSFGDWNNPGYCGNPTTDAYLEQALAALSEAEALPFWQKAQWDGQTGLSTRGEAGWAWLVNVDHTYYISECLDIGQPRLEPHGHGWPITANIEAWQWICE